MTDESTLRDKVDRGERADIALEELEKVFAALESVCFNTFRSSDVYDDIGQRSCRMYLRVMDDVKDRLVSAVRSGQQAQKELLRIKKPSKLRRIVNG